MAHSSVFATTTTLVTDEHGRALVIDPDVTAAEMTHLADRVVARGWRVVAGFATHPHWDHLHRHPAPGDGPRWVRAATAAAARHRRAALVDGTAQPWLRAEHDAQRRRAIRGWAP